MISHEYRDINKQYHEQRKDWGGYGSKWAKGVITLSKLYRTQNILDYGAGKKTLAGALPFSIESYEPAFDSELPKPADIVICTHVMEHVEPQHVDNVLSHLKQLTKKKLFIVIGTGKSHKILPDGRDSNLSIHSVEEWHRRMKQTFSSILYIDRKKFQKGKLTHGYDKETLSAIVTP